MVGETRIADQLMPYSEPPSGVWGVLITFLVMVGYLSEYHLALHLANLELLIYMFYKLDFSL